VEEEVDVVETEEEEDTETAEEDVVAIIKTSHTTDKDQ
jgi:hypothetical protein